MSAGAGFRLQELGNPKRFFLIGAVAAVLATGRPAAQTPLFTIVQTSDSQAGSESEWQGFEDVLETIARAGQSGALLPRRVDLVLFPGDITEGNDSAEWVRCRGMFDTWFTANDIPLLCVPGNRDQGENTASAQLYEQYIGSAGVWEATSAAFTGHNGIGRTTGWTGLRFIGFNNSNGAWNKISSADTALLQARVAAAADAEENIVLIAHHPHDGQGRIPLASLLTERAIVAYMRGHSGSPRARHGLSGINNPNVWDLNTNAIVEDRDLIYFEVFQTEIRAYVIVLNENPTRLPSPEVIPLVHPLRSTAAPNVGYQDASHAGARPWPTGSAPEKKLWFQGGSWWGVIWQESSLSYRIARLDTATQAWIYTGTSVSTTAARSFDALADGTKLYLASHYVSVPSAAASGQPGQVLRYSYDAASRTYALDAGFPATVNDRRTESLVIARDTTGRLWATWTSGGSVFEAHTSGDDAVWSAPATLPVAGASGLDAEDVSALVAFDGKVACLWTDRIAGKVACAVRADGSQASSWTLESALLAPGAVADTLDVATSAGRLFVATTTPNGALRVLRREVGAPGAGAWSLHDVVPASTGLAQPIVLVDEGGALLRLFATGASPTGGSALGGGVIYEKTAPLATLAFAPGKGTVVIQDGQNFALGRASSTRQALSGATGLVVLASNELSQRTWHAFDPASAPPPAPVADFSGSPRTGSAPLLVHFTDLSSGAPTDWLWDFGDGTTASVAAPDHVYAQPGAYTVSLRASNSAGSDLRSRSSYVTVGGSSPQVTLTPVADTTSNELNKSANHGTHPTLRVVNLSGRSFRTFLKFDLSDVAGTVTQARLRLFVTDASDSGGSVYAVSSSWSETGLTWNNQPVISGSSIASLGSVTANAWKEVDVTPAVTAGGLLGLAISGGSANLAIFASRESSNDPQLVLTVQSAQLPPVADFSATPRTGSAPLAVQFTDLSSGPPTAWQWDFGDGTGSTQANPAHTYAQTGTYGVTLTASNSSGADTLTRSAYVTVGGPPSASQTFFPVADARVNEASVASNYGSDTRLRSKTEAGASYRSFLKFDLTGLIGTPTSARLRLYVTDASNSGGSVFQVASSWSESAITWSNMPLVPATPLATAGAAALDTWVELDVTAAVLGPGIVSFAIAGGTTNSVIYASREGVNRPVLVIQTDDP